MSGGFVLRRACQPRYHGKIRSSISAVLSGVRLDEPCWVSAREGRFSWSNLGLILEPWDRQDREFKPVPYGESRDPRWQHYSRFAKRDAQRNSPKTRDAMEPLVIFDSTVDDTSSLQAAFSLYLLTLSSSIWLTRHPDFYRCLFLDQFMHATPPPTPPPSSPSQSSLIHSPDTVPEGPERLVPDYWFHPAIN